MRNMSVWQRIRGHYWLIVGAATFLLSALTSIIRSLVPTGFMDNLYIALDWFAACIPYFFFGAAIGLLIDRYFANRSKQVLLYPWWFWFTLGLYALGVLLAASVSTRADLSVWLVLFFPLAFGIFFTGAAFNALLPSFVQTVYYGKLILDIAFLAMFGLWLRLEFKGGARTVQRVLLCVIFLVLLVGLVSCTRSLAA